MPERLPRTEEEDRHQGDHEGPCELGHREAEAGDGAERERPRPVPGGDLQGREVAKHEERPQRVVHHRDPRVHDDAAPQEQRGEHEGQREAPPRAHGECESQDVGEHECCAVRDDRDETGGSEQLLAQDLRRCHDGRDGNAEIREEAEELRDRLEVPGAVDVHPLHRGVRAGGSHEGGAERARIARRGAVRSGSRPWIADARNACAKGRPAGEGPRRVPPSGPARAGRSRASRCRSRA